MPTLAFLQRFRFAQISERAARSFRSWPDGDVPQNGKIVQTRFNGPAFTLAALFWSSLLFGALGCSLHQKSKLPVVLKENPSATDLLAVVNQNGEKIQSLFSPNATVGVADAPGWAVCEIVFQKPANFRLIGRAALAGRVVDCGCNAERFWFWSSLQSDDELYYCRLDQYQGSAFARVLPIDPTWFPEAFGVVEIKEDEIVDGPTEQRDGSLLITSKKSRPDGVYLRRTYFDAKTAAILRQDVQNPNGATVVTVRCKESQFLETPGVVLPKKLEIFSPGTNETLIVDLGTPAVNNSEKIAQDAFDQPTDLNATAIDLGARASATTAKSTDKAGTVDENASAKSAESAARSQTVPQPVVQGTGLPIDASGRGVPMDDPAVQSTTFAPATSAANDALVAAAPVQSPNPPRSFYSNQASQTALPDDASNPNLSENPNDSAQTSQPNNSAVFANPIDAAPSDFNATGDVPFPTSPNVPPVAPSNATPRVVQPSTNVPGAPYVAPANASPFAASPSDFNDYNGFIDLGATNDVDAPTGTAPDAIANGTADFNAPAPASNAGFGDYAGFEADPLELDAPIFVDETRAAAPPQPFVVDAPSATSAPIPIVVDYPAATPSPKTDQNATKPNVSNSNRVK